MPTLINIQRAFSEVILCTTVPNGPMLVYHHNYRANFRSALALEFPVIETLVGKHCFTALAQQYQTQHPSRSGDLHHIGEQFSSFLAQEYQHSPYAYFADVAVLEWAWQECLIAPDTLAVDPTALTACASERLPKVRLQLQPSLRLVNLKWPVVTIWETNRSDSSPTGLIELALGAEWALIYRTLGGAALRRCSAAEHAFLIALKAQAELESAVADAYAIDAAFHLGRLLEELFRDALITEVYAGVSPLGSGAKNT